jgi:YidC/Oxa1 family membrane protein insertase
MGIIDTFAHLGNGILTPFYWIISGIMVLLHKVLSPVFGANAGGTWVLVIVLMTCIIRGVMLPLYKKQMNGARAMQVVQPQMKAMRDKYKDDREKLSRETMKLYEENGVSPYASCLPKIVQVPIFRALYWVIRSASMFNGDVGTLKGYWLKTFPDVATSLRESTVFGAKLSQTFTGAGSWDATRWLAVVLIVIMVAVLMIQQLIMMKRNMPPSALEGPMGQQQKMMIYIFPLMYIFTGSAVPIGVLFYWVISNSWTFGQQFWIIRHYPTPDTPAYVEWEDRMIAKGLDPKAIEAARIEKGRSKRGSAASKMMKAAMEKQEEIKQQQQAEQAGRASTASQAVVRKDEATGKQVVVRTQPRNISRAKRKR